MDIDPTLRNEVVTALRSAGASFALVFGSRARGDHRSDSDLDIAAHWAAGAPAPWDVTLPDGCDLVVIGDLPLELAGRIAMDGQVILDDDPAARVEWVATTRKIWLDERPRFERSHRDFLASVSRG